MEKMTPTARKAGTQTFKTAEDALVSEIEFAIPQAGKDATGRPIAAELEKIIGAKVPVNLIDKANDNLTGKQKTPVLKPAKEDLGNA